MLTGEFFFAEGSRQYTYKKDPPEARGIFFGKYTLSDHVFENKSLIVEHISKIFVTQFCVLTIIKVQDKVIVINLFSTKKEI